MYSKKLLLFFVEFSHLYSICSNGYFSKKPLLYFLTKYNEHCFHVLFSEKDFKNKNKKLWKSHPRILFKTNLFFFLFLGMYSHTNINHTILKNHICCSIYYILKFILPIKSKKKKKDRRNTQKTNLTFDTLKFSHHAYN